MENEKIEINRNGNKIEIAPDFNKKNIKTIINGKQYINMELNSKNQYKARTIGVQLIEDQAKQIKAWEKEIKSMIEEENNQKIKEIENKPVKTLEFKFHNYMTEKYIHTEHIRVAGRDVYSEEGIKIMAAVKRLSLEQLKKLGIEGKDDVWQEINLSDEDKKFIIEQGAINEREIEEMFKKTEKAKTEKKEAIEREETIKKEEALKKAIKTGEKQAISSSSAMADDGNIIIITKYIHPDGETSTDEFYDGD